MALIFYILCFFFSDIRLDLKAQNIYLRSVYQKIKFVTHLVFDIQELDLANHEALRINGFLCWKKFNSLNSFKPIQSIKTFTTVCTLRIRKRNMLGITRPFPQCDDFEMLPTVYRTVYVVADVISCIHAQLLFPEPATIVRVGPC